MITWVELNKILRTADEELCLKLLKDEEAGHPGRPRWMLRIHSRLNRLRASRERDALGLAQIEHKAEEAKRLKDERQQQALRAERLATEEWLASERKIASRK